MAQVSLDIPVHKKVEFTNKKNFLIRVFPSIFAAYICFWVRKLSKPQMGIKKVILTLGH